MDIVRDLTIDWLRYRWFLIVSSLVLVLVGAASLAGRGLNLGIDFVGGTLVYVKFKEAPDIEEIRLLLAEEELGLEGVTRFDSPFKNQLQIRISGVQEESERSLNQDSQEVFQALKNNLDREAPKEKIDLNNTTAYVLAGCFRNVLQGQPCIGSEEPDSSISELALDDAVEPERLAKEVIDFRTENGGILHDKLQLERVGLPIKIMQALQETFYLGNFAILSVESVGPKVGRELQEKAQNAILFSLLGIVAYIAFRFKGISYGLAAIVALFHDVFITLGLFSIFGKEISLTVVAGLLTVVGYSINDTIVVFDRVRENLRLMRRSNFRSVINASINQTLNRTILTSGMTFVAVMALYLMGGQVLNGFSFALVVGVLVGTYSSIGIATPMVHWWEIYRNRNRTGA